MRFVAAIQNSTTVFMNAPFTTTPVAGSVMGPTINYSLAESLASASIFDYWDPSTAVQRIVEGAAMDKMQIKVNGDFQEFDFSGPARDLVDSASFHERAGRADAVSGGADDGGFDYTIVPGHLGEVWMGVVAGSVLDDDGGGTDAGEQHRAAGEGVRERFCAVHCGGGTVGDAELQHCSNMADAQTQALYQAARQRSPISVMLQLGEQASSCSGRTCRRWCRRFRSSTIGRRGCNGNSKTTGHRGR